MRITNHVLQLPELRRCIVVVGPESSGSKLAARIAAHALVWPDRQFWGHQGWRGHGDAANISLGHIVMHRSLPHGDKKPYYPDVRGIVQKLQRTKDCDVRLVVAVRDENIALLSKIQTHQRHVGTAMREQLVATAMLRDLLKEPRAAPIFIWSHEAFNSYQDVYAEIYLDMN